MKPTYRFLFITTLLFSTLSSRAQLVLTNDTLLCQPTNLTLQAQVDTDLVTTGMDDIDDIYSPAINIGFNFTFYGNTYSQCLLSSNAYICFDLSQAQQYSQWPIGDAIPSANNPTNSIFGVWHDVDPSVPNTGLRGYNTIGVAPNRRFVYTFCNIPMYQCNATLYSGQIVLYETTNEIDINITHKELCTTWNDGAAIVGVQDEFGIDGVAAPGRNYPTQWTANNESWRFTPNGSTYTVAAIPYSPIPYGSPTITWYDQNGDPIGNGTTVNVFVNQSTFYFASNSACSGLIGDTVYATMAVDQTLTTTDVNCDAGTLGTATSDAEGAAPFTFIWMNAASDTLQMTGNDPNTIPNLAPGNYNLLLIDGDGCYNQIPFTIDQSPFNVTVAPDNANCAGGNDGFAIATMTNPNNYQYTWYTGSFTQIADHLNNDENDTLTALTPGNYNVVVQNSIGCIDTTAFVVGADAFDAQFSYSPNAICTFADVTYTNSSVGNISTYAWAFGDGSNSALVNPIHNYTTAGNYTTELTISGAGGCVDSAEVNFDVNPATIANFSFSPPAICVGDEVAFTDLTNNTPNAWAWSFGDGNTSTQQNPTHTYTQSGTFNIQLTATGSQCGTDDTTLTYTVNAYPVADLGNDTTACAGQTLYLSAMPGGMQYVWSNGDTTQVSGILVDQEQTVNVTVSNNGCASVDSVHIGLSCVHVFPNAFTPNKDGNNDVFSFQGLGVKDVELHVYNRWGQQIYNEVITTGIDGWDGTFSGKEQPVGTYVFSARVTYFNDLTEQIMGEVSLLR